MLRTDRPRVGARVTIPYGRWAGRTGTVAGIHRNPGGTIQRSQGYPVVDLDPAGRAKARRVRVLAVDEHGVSPGTLF